MSIIKIFRLNILYSAKFCQSANLFKHFLSLFDVLLHFRKFPLNHACFAIDKYHFWDGEWQYTCNCFSGTYLTTLNCFIVQIYSLRNVQGKILKCCFLCNYHYCNLVLFFLVYVQLEEQVYLKQILWSLNYQICQTIKWQI